MKTYTLEICMGWVLNLHGTSYSEIVGDFTVHYNTNENTWIELCMCDVGDKKGTDVEKAEMILTGMYDTSGAESKEKESVYSSTYIGGKAIIYHCTDWESDTEYWFLEGVKVKGGQYVLSRIGYKKEEQKAWAIDRWNSIMKLEEN